MAATVRAVGGESVLDDSLPTGISGTVCILDSEPRTVGWHVVTVTIDTVIGEATSYLNGGFDGYQCGLPLRGSSLILEQGTEIWVGARPPTDLDAFGRSDSEGAESKMQIMDAFLWGRCLSEDEITALHAATSPMGMT
ncbi:hypothetical protein HPP92_024359 [Vanilla planifolia]|uniref:Uncharacterized protein n=1 Tax=Vanilla planifolia TaxID=51239 RepID=A0A835PK45_VANPL|nr:hypothetical protein HPP92_024698 [Vanilla planifolia]KAG0456571.1 hypothetical protein HPP92_024359 [Vanilla planifolia]